MIEPYFALWLHATQEISKEKSLFEDYRASWASLISREKKILIVTFAFAAVVLILSVSATFNSSLYAVYWIAYLLFLIVGLAAGRVAIARDRRIPEQRLDRKSEIYRKLQSDLKGVGLTTREQLVFLRDEAVRVLEQREHRQETIVNRAIEVFILVGLVSAINLTIEILGRDGFPLEPAVFLLASAIFVFGVLVLIVLTLWIFVDRMGPIPLPKLCMFVDDLTGMLVQIPDAPRQDECRRRARPRRACAARTPHRRCTKY